MATKSGSLATKSSSILRRSMLYVPGSSKRKILASLNVVADNVTYDLEDSVTAAEKVPARDRVRDHLRSIGVPGYIHRYVPRQIGEIAVRINSVSSPHALNDLINIAPQLALDAVVVPKVEHPADLTFVSNVLRQLVPHRQRLLWDGDGGDGAPQRDPIRLLAIIESARGITNLPAICNATPYLSGLIYAAEDFALDLSLTRTPHLLEQLYARCAIVTNARAAGLPSAIDLVCTSYVEDPEAEARGERTALARLEEECLNGRSLGFNGKQCIHPLQLETVQRFFSPLDSEVEWAARVVIANEKAAAAGHGAWTLDGKMVDAPVVGKARAILDKARKCDIYVQSVLDKWQHQEPELGGGGSDDAQEKEQ
ncbi:Pyruvate/Phosphoenolpyruvate kinase-like domain-containing protein [Durotheca rogersii]|uniref:Pyruvate/Phosphoenolpyruvate kinase-like domain-containing protein n=1 Tax=Durotheca rogersii TaxID=419775 RepID=UPI00221F60A8|nr:Pyruvate/Phosphoenolpyruvate kinase-like domain-containing protein [Durotheca rogersii]KAI5866428.1 Pyruvate/Phosphoenolpyruvate kinase-like domain-containing protein [Durotheca rogersii]